MVAMGVLAGRGESERRDAFVDDARFRLAPY